MDRGRRSAHPGGFNSKNFTSAIQRRCSGGTMKSLFGFTAGAAPVLAADTARAQSGPMMKAACGLVDGCAVAPASGSWSCSSSSLLASSHGSSSESDFHLIAGSPSPPVATTGWHRAAPAAATQRNRQRQQKKRKTATRQVHHLNPPARFCLADASRPADRSARDAPSIGDASTLVLPPPRREPHTALPGCKSPVTPHHAHARRGLESA